MPTWLKTGGNQYQRQPWRTATLSAGNTNSGVKAKQCGCVSLKAAAQTIWRKAQQRSAAKWRRLAGGISNGQRHLAKWQPEAWLAMPVINQLAAKTES